METAMNYLLPGRACITYPPIWILIGEEAWDNSTFSSLLLRFQFFCVLRLQRQNILDRPAERTLSHKKHCFAHTLSLSRF